MSLKGNLIFLTILISFASCISAPVVIEEGMTREKYFQKAQEAYDKQRYKDAITYYNSFLEKYADDPTYSIMAEYELAFIDYKTGNMKEAKAGFQKILEKYKLNPLQPYPRWTKILSEKLLAEIEAIEFKKEQLEE